MPTVRTVTVDCGLALEAAGVKELSDRRRKEPAKRTADGSCAGASALVRGRACTWLVIEMMKNADTSHRPVMDCTPTSNKSHGARQHKAKHASVSARKQQKDDAAK
jgi:hypothetical protein